MTFNYQTITKEHLERFICKEKEDGIVELSLPRCQNNIQIKLPFILDEKIASLAGLMPDGSLIKDIRRIYFVQKKDFNKHILFQDTINELFRIKNKIFMKNTSNALESYTNSTVLCHFLHFVLDFKKSDQKMRAPEWLFTSPNSVKRAYLREAFAMEGCIFKSLSEIRFISKFEDYARDIQSLLLQLGITSHVKPRIGGTYGTIQYRLSVYRKENFQKFKEIGFTVPLHFERFTKICEKYKI
ncbi:TPA: hypothetical protein HA278_07035 [Candidatus Woesearchaeota archaeon]|nr:hypothetical protein [archaeon]HIJ11787.1 hypothetical protein [Candidatus Woesearchaeota archaeon]|tara:strand:+ start:425 stop:1150 length:726 start_codon:yes stop_codon:yes gene_type:complete